MAYEMMDVAHDRPYKNEELSDEAMSFIANPKNKKSAKTHSRYQSQHVKQCNEESNRKLESETTLLNYFAHLVITSEHGPGIMWSMCSCLK